MARTLMVLACVLSFVLGGCGVAYNVTGAAAKMSIFGGPQTVRDSLTDAEIRDVLVVEPLASFPAKLAVARVQASGYCNYAVKSYGYGQYSVVTTRDIETDKDFERI